MKQTKTKGHYDGTGASVLHGIADMLRKKKKYGFADESISMDGKTCMITGANSGLGFASAERLARMGAKVVMACRSGIPDAGEKLKQKTGSENISMEYVDLARLETINDLAARLKKQGIIIDVLVCNAGVVCGTSRLTADGFETMFQVNFLAKFHLLNTFLKQGLLRTGQKDGTTPSSRVLFVSSEVHRSGLEPDIATLGRPYDYGMKMSVTWYGYSKLLLTTFARELARRYAGPEAPKLSVFILCPGPVASNIGREAPKLLRPLLKLVFAVFFRSPRKAADPIIFFASDKTLEGRTDIYLHLMTRKDPDPRTADHEFGKTLWEKCSELLEGASDLS